MKHDWQMSGAENGHWCQRCKTAWTMQNHTEDCLCVEKSMPSMRAGVLLFGGIMRPLILLAVLALQGIAHAAEIDMPLLRDMICTRESRHLNYPMFAVGDGGSSRGECQMSVATAEWMIPWAVRRGYVPSYMLAMLADRQALTYFLHYKPVNFALSEAYLYRIAKKRKVRTVRELAYFWNAGHNSERFGAKPDSVAFANEVWIMYKGPPLASPKITQQRTFARN